jgi:hypothetical protein
MTRGELNAALRSHAKTLSPTSDEQELISKIYNSINDLLGISNCIQIGSYPRRTAITPLHDLDVLYILGRWDQNNHNPETTLKQLYSDILQKYSNPTQYRATVSLQTHSVTIEYKDSSDNPIFSVDIVPAYTFSTNEFGDPTYKVPEVIKQKNHEVRHRVQWDPNQDEGWINSDPRGYITTATKVNAENSDFRKAVKIVKDWKNRLKDADETLKLKSFHLEQVITQMFQVNSNQDLFDAIFGFFVDLPDTIADANQIPDRANADKYIDDYLAQLTPAQKAKIIASRDNVLIALEKIDPTTDIATVFEPKFSARNPDEKFMFDHGIPVHIDRNNRKLAIAYDETTPNRKERRRASRSHQPIGNKLYFHIIDGIDDAMTYFWKVKNSDQLSSDKRRGEITKHRTLNHPETTAWSGTHLVECFAVNPLGICVDSALVEVPIAAES